MFFYLIDGLLIEWENEGKIKLSDNFNTLGKSIFVCYHIYIGRNKKGKNGKILNLRKSYFR